MAPRSNVVTWTDDDRRELRELWRVHDRMIAEARANDPGEELAFKVMKDARPPVPEPEPEPFTEYQSDVLAHVIVELRKEWREEGDEAIAPLKAEIADLNGKLDAVLTFLGQKEFKSADVIDLPGWRKRDAA
jgi:hypothetical protein